MSPAPVRLLHLYVSQGDSCIEAEGEQKEEEWRFRLFLQCKVLARMCDQQWKGQTRELAGATGAEIAKAA